MEALEGFMHNDGDAFWPSRSGMPETSHSRRG